MRKVLIPFILLLPLYSIAQKPITPKGWKAVRACGFEFIVPDAVRFKETPPGNGCRAALEGGGVTINLRYSNDVPILPSDLTIVSDDITIGGVAARLNTYRSKDVDWIVTSVHMTVDRPGEVTETKSLALGIGSNSQIKPEIVKEIYESIKYVGRQH